MTIGLRMNKNLCLDLDDCILNLRVPLMQALNFYTGKNIHWRDWGGYNLESIYGVSTEEFIKLMIDSQVIERALPHNGVKEAIDILKNMGYNINIITARGWHPNGYDLTVKWFNDNNIYFDTINIVKLGSNKADIMDTLENVICLIDDNEKNCKDVISRGYKAYLLTMPWNKHLQLDQISHIEDIVTLL